MPAFQHLGQAPRQAPPGQPTGNGFQVAGEALQGLGQLTNQYGQIFEKMVDDRKQAVLQANQQAVQEKKNQLYFEEQEREKAQREAQEKREAAYWDTVGKLKPTDEGYEQSMEQAFIKYQGGKPEDFHKAQMAPIEKTKDREYKEGEFDRQSDVRQEHTLEAIRARNRATTSTKKAENRYKGFDREQTKILKAVDEGAIPIESQKENVRFMIEDLNIKSNELIRIGDKVSDERAKRIRDKQYKLEEFLRVLDGWETQDEGSSTNNGKSIPKPIQEAMDWIKANPNDPRTPGHIARLRKEGYYD